MWKCHLILILIKNSIKDIYKSYQENKFGSESNIINEINKEKINFTVFRNLGEKIDVKYHVQGKFII